MTQTMTGRARSVRVTLPTCRSGLGLGTGVMTAEGEIPVEFLEPGERVVTLDKGLVPLSALVARKLPAHSVIRVRPAVLDPAGEGRDFLISAQQTLLIRGWQAHAMFGKPAALVRAERLIDGAFMSRLSGDAPIRLFQLLFKDSQHVVHLSDMRLQAASARLPTKTPA